MPKLNLASTVDQVLETLNSVQVNSRTSNLKLLTYFHVGKLLEKAGTSIQKSVRPIIVAKCEKNKYRSLNSKSYSCLISDRSRKDINRQLVYSLMKDKIIPQKYHEEIIKITSYTTLTLKKIETDDIENG